jgi:FixJ family two-component response regulator
MSEAETTVFVVEDDPSYRRAIARLIGSVGHRVVAFGSAPEFLHSTRPDDPACLVLDVRLPGLSGLDLQRELADRPIIFITGHGDIPMTVQAMRAGAVEFLTKPFRDQELLDAIRLALERDRATRTQRVEMSVLRHRVEQLTPRERTVMHLVVQGRLNKQIATDLGTTEKTIKVHRGRVMQKMQASSVADLVRMAAKLADANS